MRLEFAVAGVPHSTPRPGGTVEGLFRCKFLGIMAMEIEWVQRVPQSEERMAEIRETAEELGISLTVHAPYFVNLNSSDTDKRNASIQRILLALTMAEKAGARSVCVHPAFYGSSTPREAYAQVREATEKILMKKSKQFPHVNLAYETMGKPTQFGTLEEVLSLSKEFDLYPCIDPAHMHARTNGAWNSLEEWNRMFDLVAKALGKASLQHVHMHFSGINYTASGERNHLPLQKSDAKWKEFVGVLKKRGIGGTVVSESPLLEEDTLLLKTTYEKM